MAGATVHFCHQRAVAIGIGQQHRDISGSPYIGQRQIDRPIAVEVAGNQTERASSVPYGVVPSVLSTQGADDFMKSVARFTIVIQAFHRFTLFNHGESS